MIWDIEKVYVIVTLVPFWNSALVRFSKLTPCTLVFILLPSPLIFSWWSSSDAGHLLWAQAHSSSHRVVCCFPAVSSGAASWSFCHNSGHAPWGEARAFTYFLSLHGLERHVLHIENAVYPSPVTSPCPVWLPSTLILEFQNIKFTKVLFHKLILKFKNFELLHPNQVTFSVMFYVYIWS